jgi:hypothetical protein
MALEPARLDHSVHPVLVAQLHRVIRVTLPRAGGPELTVADIVELRVFKPRRSQRLTVRLDDFYAKTVVRFVAATSILDTVFMIPTEHASGRVFAVNASHAGLIK